MVIFRYLLNDFISGRIIKYVRNYRFTPSPKVGILLYALCLSCQIPQPQLSAASIPSKTFFAVTRIVDGDTFWVNNNTPKGLKIRIIGIDAPEAKRTFNREAGYYGIESKMYLTKMLTGKRVRLVSDVDSLDRYGRTLSYVYLEDGTFVNAELLKNGYAVLLTIPPNVAFADHFAKLQREARGNKRGLWGGGKVAGRDGR